MEKNISFEGVQKLAATVSSNGSVAPHLLDLCELTRQVFKEFQDFYGAPSEVIKAVLQARGLESSYLAKILNSRSRASEVLSGKKLPSLKEIRTICSNLAIPADLLIFGDSKAVDFSRYPVADMVKSGFISEDVRKKDKAMEHAITEFFARAGLTPEKIQAACFRKTEKINGKANQNALYAWMAGLKILSKNISVTKKYSMITAKEIKELCQLSAKQEGPRDAVEYLLSKGIKVVILHNFAKTYVDGAIFFDDVTPVIGLSLRYDRLDNFWFTLLHEVAHLFLGHVNDNTVIFDDMDLDVTDPENKEAQADEYAKNSLISIEKWKKFVNGHVSIAQVCAAAQEWQVSPAIVAGRYRHETKNYKIFTQLVGCREVRRLFQPERSIS